MSGQLVNGRIMPNLPVSAYRTFELSAPLSTHRRRATCAEVECDAYAHGWVTRVLPDSDMERALLAACRGDIDGTRRTFSRIELGLDGTRPYVFVAGTPCFKASEHTVPLEREPIYRSRGGDWRGSTGSARIHTRGDYWVEEFGENQQRLHDAIEKG